MSLHCAYTGLLKQALIPALLLALMTALMWHSATVESQTYDEAVHLSAGYSYFRTGDFRMNPEHPPLTKLLQAAPLLAMNLALDTATEAWTKPDSWAFSQRFVYHNTAPAARILLAGRAMTMLFALLLGCAVFYWTRSVAGPLAATIALALYTLDPNFIAHGHYITSDVAVSLAIFASVITWLRYLETGTRRALLFAAVALGLAVVTKFNALYLLPVHALVALLHPNKLPLAKRLTATVATFAAAAAFIAITYGPATPRAFLTNPRKPLATLRDNHPYSLGVQFNIAHNTWKQPSYLLGEKHAGGKWRYFPVAFAVKTPAASLIAFGVLISALLLPPALLRRHWLMLFYPAIYFGITMASDINLGLRHILPIYPFLYALAGIALSQLTTSRVPVLALLTAIATFETARIHPDHIAFFNLFAGGPDNGPHLLLDSNLDWGQDLLKLKAYLGAHGTNTVAFAYFGSAEPADFGIRVLGLPGVWDTAEIAKIDGYAAISMTNLYDVYFDKPTYTWLRERTPAARIGRSILVYDLRKPK
jgi:4-amino-4-deoxy-L-arabinose transferase-like glycosyltransferase